MTSLPARVRPLVLVVSLLLAVLAALVVASPAAQAHDVLLESSPADGAEVAEAPDQLVLTFSGELLDTGQAVALSTDGGETFGDIPGAVDGPRATFPLPDLDAGTYTATWSVVSSDGHRIDGTVTFTVAAGAAPTDGATAGATAAPTTDAPAETGSDSAAAPTTPAEEPQSDGLGAPGWVWLVLAVGALGGIIAIAVRSWPRG